VDRIRSRHVLAGTRCFDVLTRVSVHKRDRSYYRGSWYLYSDDDDNALFQSVVFSVLVSFPIGPLLCSRLFSNQPSFPVLSFFCHIICTVCIVQYSLRLYRKQFFHVSSLFGRTRIAIDLVLHSFVRYAIFVCSAVLYGFL